VCICLPAGVSKSTYWKLAARLAKSTPTSGGANPLNTILALRNSAVYSNSEAVAAATAAASSDGPPAASGSLLAKFAMQTLTGVTRSGKPLSAVAKAVMQQGRGSNDGGNTNSGKVSSDSGATGGSAAAGLAVGAAGTGAPVSNTPPARAAAALQQQTGSPTAAASLTHQVTVPHVVPQREGTDVVPSSTQGSSILGSSLAPIATSANSRGGSNAAGGGGGAVTGASPRLAPLSPLGKGSNRSPQGHLAPLATRPLAKAPGSTGSSGGGPSSPGVSSLLSRISTSQDSVTSNTSGLAGLGRPLKGLGAPLGPLPGSGSTGSNPGGGAN
jgi:hypothetical protein